MKSKLFTVVLILTMFSISACDNNEDQLRKEREAKAAESQRRAKAAEDYYFGKTKERPHYSDDQK
jgi:hypothetical protein